jgi:arylsulfatase A-like enzyme
MCRVAIFFFWATVLLCSDRLPIVHGQVDRPNVLVINVDDLDTFLLGNGRASGVLPNLDRMAREGVEFTNCHVTSPLCGPSRASLLTGRYVFGHGVRTHSNTDRLSNGFPGGFGHYRDRNPRQQIGLQKPDWRQHEFSVFAQQAGYRTMMVGKYLHGGFNPDAGQTWESLRPSGWDDFYASLGGDYFDFPRYLSRRGGRFQEEIERSTAVRPEDYAVWYRGHLQSGYRTNLEFMDAIRLIEEHRTDGPQQPFLMYLAPFAPHKATRGSMLDTRYEQWWLGMRQPWRPDFNLFSVVGKPASVAGLPMLSEARWAQADQEYRQRMLAMKSCDDMLGVLLDYLEQSGEADRTLIMFTSDNGFMLGQQRHLGKQLPYDLSTRVPLIVWGPGVGVGSGFQRTHLVSHVDFLPTILEMCQVPAVPSDGQSLRPLWGAGPGPAPELWRPNGVLTEHFQRLGHAHQNLEGVYHSVRFFDQRYTRWADGSTEYYDLQMDPWELQNRSGQLTSGERHLFERLLVDFRLPTHPYGGSIASPRFDGETVFRRVHLDGYAEATAGVAEVRLVITRPASGLGSGSGPEYFNGQTWQTPFHQVRADLVAPNTSVTKWDYDFFPGVNAEHRMDVTARVFDRNGQFQTQVFRRWFQAEFQSPATGISDPVEASTVASRARTFSLSGWAKGETALREVRVVVRDRDTGEFFDGALWRPGFRFVQADTQSIGDPTYLTWEFELPATQRPRRLVVTARAYQEDGVFDQTVATHRVDIL